MQTQEHDEEGDGQYLLTRKRESKPTAPSKDNADLLQRSKEIQEQITEETWRGYNIAFRNYTDDREN